MQMLGALRRRNHLPLVAFALAAILVPLLILSILAANHISRIGDAVHDSERENLNRFALFACRELAASISQHEGDILEFLDLTSEDSVIESLKLAELAFPGITCFLLMNDGTFRYPVSPGQTGDTARVALPPPESLAGLHPDAPPLESAHHLTTVLENRDAFLALDMPDGVGRIYLPSAGVNLIASLHQFRARGSVGMIGICWSKTHIEHWCTTISKDSLFDDHHLALRDSSGAPIYAGTSGGGTDFETDMPMPPDSFPWTIAVAPRTPGTVSDMVRRQVIFQSGVLFALCLLILVGAWILVTVAVREIELGRLKADFAANVSHELRTPLALVRAAGEALSMRHDLSPEKQERYLKIIATESQRLTELINTVLSFTKMSRGADAFQLRATDIVEFVRGFVEDHRLAMNGAGFQLDLQLPADPLYAYADADGLHLVLVNLLDNAMKFSKQRRELGVAVESAGKWVCLRVRDGGIGIAKEEQERIFESFYRVEASLVKETRGTGIGLALCKQIIDAHGGLIEVASEPGEGATFSVSLKPAQPESPDPRST